MLISWTFRYKSLSRNERKSGPGIGVGVGLGGSGCLELLTTGWLELLPINEEDEVCEGVIVELERER